MLKLKKLSLIVGSLSLLATANAAEMAATEESCATTTMEQASIYYSKSIEVDGDPGKLYEQYVKEINDIALKHEFKQYTMSSDGVSISSSSYNNMLDVSVNISIEYVADFAAITALSQNTKANSISSQRYAESCE